MANKEAPGPEPDQSDWVNHAISKGMPSYEAWDLTPEQIAKKFGPLPKPEPTEEADRG